MKFNFLFYKNNNLKTNFIYIFFNFRLFIFLYHKSLHIFTELIIAIKKNYILNFFYKLKLIYFYIYLLNFNFLFYPSIKIDLLTFIFLKNILKINI